MLSILDYIACKHNWPLNLFSFQMVHSVFPVERTVICDGGASLPDSSQLETAARAPESSQTWLTVTAAGRMWSVSTHTHDTAHLSRLSANGWRLARPPPGDKKEKNTLRTLNSISHKALWFRWKTTAGTTTPQIMADSKQPRWVLIVIPCWFHISACHRIDFRVTDDIRGRFCWGLAEGSGDPEVRNKRHSVLLVNSRHNIAFWNTNGLR